MLQLNWHKIIKLNQKILVILLAPSSETVLGSKVRFTSLNILCIKAYVGLARFLFAFERFVFRVLGRADPASFKVSKVKYMYRL